MVTSEVQITGKMVERWYLLCRSYTAKAAQMIKLKTFYDHASSIP